MHEFLTGEAMSEYAERRKEELARERGFERRTFGLKRRGQTGGVGGGTLDLPIKPAAAWFRFGVGITASGGFVSQWNDASGNNRHLKQTTATNQPQLMPDTSILFDGVDNFLQADAFTLNQPVSLYMLFRQVTETALDRLFDGSAAAFITSQTGTAAALVFNAGAAFNVDGTLALGSYGVLTCVANGVSSVAFINNTTPTVSDGGANNPGGFTLASSRAAANFANIQVKEVVIYAAAHNAAQRAQVINYLQQVGGLV